jgi:hypothetical protein
MFTESLILGPELENSLPKNVELMPQHQHLGLQLLSRLEAVAQHADE